MALEWDLRRLGDQEMGVRFAFYDQINYPPLWAIFYSSGASHYQWCAIDLANIVNFYGLFII